jgi:uncharacterized membrane protein
MNWYLLFVYLHVLAVMLWIGHMFFWVTAAGTITKRFLSPETKAVVIELRDEFGQVGWYALFVLVVTGIVILYYYRGITFSQLTSKPFDYVLDTKLLLVGLMILFQGFVGPSRAILGWFNFLIALGVIWLSVLLVRGGA